MSFNYSEAFKNCIRADNEFHDALQDMMNRYFDKLNKEEDEKIKFFVCDSIVSVPKIKTPTPLYGWFGGNRGNIIFDEYTMLRSPLYTHEFDPFIKGQLLWIINPPSFISSLIEPKSPNEFTRICMDRYRYRLYPYPGKDGTCPINFHIQLKIPSRELRISPKLNRQIR